MNDSDDDRIFSFNDEEDGIRKFSKKCAPNLTMYIWEDERMFDDGAERFFVLL